MGHTALESIKKKSLAKVISVYSNNKVLSAEPEGVLV